MPNADDTADRQQLLATHRRTLAHYLNQQAMLGPAYAPPALAHGIAEAREQIRQLKVALRDWGVAVEDLPGDEPSEISAFDFMPGTGTIAALYQLRAAASDFVGREHEIARLVQAFSRAIERGAGAIGAIRGLGGIGKTELAYAVAQRLAPLYPDAQLLVELRGASGQSLAPHQALQHVIRAFEPQARLPDDLSDLQALYRSILSGKRALVLADDTRNAAQVRPLLPPPGSGLLITGRQRFSLPGMAALDLGILPQSDAERMLVTICPQIGAGATQLARLCGALPLALRVSAGLLASDATRSVERYIQALTGERARLAQLRDPDDPDVDVEASIGLSYDGLDPAAQSVLCQLSIFPASFDQAAALAVVALPEPANAEAQGVSPLEDVISALYRRSLLEYDTALERFALQDLVRIFTAARLIDRVGAELRYARHYVGVAQRADERYSQGDQQVRAGLMLFDQERAHIDQAWAWARQQPVSRATDELILAYALATTHTGNLRYDKRRERLPQLEAAVLAARRLGARDREGRLLNNLGLAYAALGEARQAIGLYERALAVARETSDRRGEGNALINLGGVYSDLGEIQRAIVCYEHALAIDQESGDQRGEANLLNSLGLAHWDRGETQQAIALYERSLAMKQASGDRRGEANTLSNLGLAYADLGEIERAIEFYELALAIVHDLGDRRGEGVALGNLADAYAARGDHRRAIEWYERSLAIKREVGDRGGEATSSWNLGLLLEEQGELERAAAHMQVCIDFEREMNHPDAEKDAARLEALLHRLRIPAIDHRESKTES
jgi:tetratricopeptide (TPR) repeat protein